MGLYPWPQLGNACKASPATADLRTGIPEQSYGLRAVLFLTHLRQQPAQLIEQRRGLVGFAALRQQPFDLLIEAALVLLGLRYEPAVQFPAGPDRDCHALGLRHSNSPRIFNLMQIAASLAPGQRSRRCVKSCC